MVVHRHQDMSKTPSGANHVLRSFRMIYDHARRTYDLAQCPAMAIEWYGETSDGRIIDDLKGWRQTIDDLNNPIHRVFYELLLFTDLRKTEVLTLQWHQIQEDRILSDVSICGTELRI